MPLANMVLPIIAFISEGGMIVYLSKLWRNQKSWPSELPKKLEAAQDEP